MTHTDPRRSLGVGHLARPAMGSLPFQTESRRKVLSSDRCPLLRALIGRAFAYQRVSLSAAELRRHAGGDQSVRTGRVASADDSLRMILLSCHLEVAPGGAPIARAIWPPTNQDPGGSRTHNVAAL